MRAGVRKTVRFFDFEAWFDMNRLARPIGAASQSLYERVMRQHNEQMELIRLYEPNYNHDLAIEYDQTYAYIWTGSVRSNISMMRNEFDQTYTLEDFVRSRSMPQYFNDTFFEKSHFPSVQVSNLSPEFNWIVRTVE